MRISVVVLAFVASLLLFPLTGYPQWHEGGRPVEDTEWHKSIDGFGASLLVTDSPEEFIESWNQPASPEYQPKISTTNRAHRGDTVEAVVLFQGCRADGAGFCDATTDFVILRPDGSEYGALPDGELWQGKQAPPQGVLLLGVVSLVFIVEAEDPLGEYTIQAKVCDSVGEVCLDLVQKLEVEVSG